MAITIFAFIGVVVVVWIVFDWFYQNANQQSGISPKPQNKESTKPQPIVGSKPQLKYKAASRVDLIKIHLHNLIINKSSTMSFGDSFNKNQKGAILGFLIFVINSDNEVHSKEDDYLGKISKLIEVEDPSRDAIPCTGLAQLVNVLNTLTMSQKEWLVVTMNDLILVDNKVDPREVNAIGEIFPRIGIDHTKYMEIIDKSKALLNMFTKK